jgi:hypothetical protein
MMKRLEQVAALVVAAGLAIVSYWLFFSWAQGGGPELRKKPQQSSQRVGVPGDMATPGLSCPRSLEAAAGLDQPLLGGAIVEAGDMGFHLFGIDGKPLGSSDLHDPTQGSTGIL